ncbi:MAG TPA: NADH-quinone oxidoreductase subunit N [Isosphaeraceae bacterium]|nr:NADH-quinone oxidoreductase subunit N [Isosphaeraceae bacterium]
MPTSAFEYEVTRQTLLILVPELLLLVAATVMMTAGPFVRLPRRAWCAAGALALVAALVALFALHDRTTDLYTAVALNDAFSFWARVVFVLSGLVLLALAHDQVDDARAAEFFGTFLMIDAGSMLVAAANEMVFLFVGLELVSIPTYLLLYLPRRNASTQEAATKYFFLSIFSSGLMLFGLTYLYGLTGITNLKALAYLAHSVPNVVPQPQLALIAIVFIMAGLGFRVAAVPFHFYAPDVYQGSPTVVAATLAWIPKAIGFLAIVRTLTAIVAAAGPDSPLGNKAVMIAWIMAVITMTLGNTVALTQENLKRLLAYSSIAHAGYLLIGVVVAFRNEPGVEGRYLYLGTEGMLFYLVAYALMTLGAFGVIVLLSSPERTVETVDDLAGLGRTRPAAAVAMAVCLFSLAGIPPFAGFWGKFELFASAFSASHGRDARIFQWLAIIGVLTSAVGAYYYLRIVVVMYLRPAPTKAPLASRPGWPTVAAVAACAGLSVILGLFPAPVAHAARRAAAAAVAQPDPIPEAVAVERAR